MESENTGIFIGMIADHLQDVNGEALEIPCMILGAGLSYIHIWELN